MDPIQVDEEQISINAFIGIDPAAIFFLRGEDGFYLRDENDDYLGFC